jgi:hypothetical protein
MVWYPQIKFGVWLTNSSEHDFRRGDEPFVAIILLTGLMEIAREPTIQRKKSVRRPAVLSDDALTG